MIITNLTDGLLIADKNGKKISHHSFGPGRVLESVGTEITSIPDERGLVTVLQSRTVRRAKGYHKMATKDVGNKIRWN